MARVVVLSMCSARVCVSTRLRMPLSAGAESGQSIRSSKTPAGRPTFPSQTLRRWQRFKSSVVWKVRYLARHVAGPHAVLCTDSGALHTCTKYTHTHIHKHTQSFTHSCIHAHIHIHTHMHAYIQTQVHGHTLAFFAAACDRLSHEHTVRVVVCHARCTGIIPALETSHAIAYAMKLAPTMKPDESILINLSGRGDKDMIHVADVLNIKI